MNLAEAIVYVDAMTDAEKAVWDEANRFMPDAERDRRAVKIVGLLDGVMLPAEDSEVVIPDVLTRLANAAHNLTIDLHDVARLLRIWPDDEPNMPQDDTWLEPA